MRFVRLTLLLSFCAALLVSARADDQRGVPASHGIANFGQVDPHLWRGAQPDEAGLTTLKKLGAVLVINLRMTGDVMTGEETAANRVGLRYVNVPLPGLSAPDAADVTRVLDLIAKEKGPVFVHCEHGADRTGTIVACYRIQHDHWTADQALTEAKVYGMSFWEFGMKRFVRNFRAPTQEQLLFRRY